MAGTVALTFDDEAVTLLARWGARVSQPQWPALLRGIPPDSISARMSEGGRIDVTVTGFPPMVLHPVIGPDGALDVQLRVESKNPAAIFNVAAPFVNRMLAKVLNERITKVQRDLAERGLDLRLTSVRTSAGVLTVTGAIAATG